MLCIESKSFIYARFRPIFAVPPEEAADMSTLRAILDGIREAALCCIGSPHSRTRQLAALRNLDAHLLKDIGITAEEAKQGAAWRTGTADDAPNPPVRLEIRRLYLNR